MDVNKPIITVNNASFSYASFTKSPGFSGALKDMIHRKYERVSAIKNVTLKVKAGEIIGLLGANGAGKTTLIKMLTGIVPTQKGEVILFGNMTPFQKKKDFLKNIGVMLSQKSQLIWDLPPIDTLRLLRVIYQLKPEEFDRRLRYFTRKLSVEKQLKTPVRKLSLGQRIKFELICSIIHYPKILFLDEPTIGIDVASQLNIYSFLKELNEKYRITIILTSHNTKDIKAVAKRVVLINRGTKIFDGALVDLVNKYASHSLMEIATDKPLIPLPAGYKRIDDYHYRIDSSKTDLVPNLAQHLISINRVNSDLDSILSKLFGSGA